MVRKFVSLDGEVLAEENWVPNDKHGCFWCGDFLKSADSYPCPFSFDGLHDWVTVCHKEYA